jgi:hypothetical protein
MTIDADMISAVLADHRERRACPEHDRCSVQSVRAGCLCATTVAAMELLEELLSPGACALLAERDALRAEVASLRLTLGGRTHSAADVVEPIGCPCPGACVQVAEIARLRAQIAAARREGAEAMREAVAGYLEGVADRCEMLGNSETYKSRAAFVRGLVDPHIGNIPLPGDDASARPTSRPRWWRRCRWRSASRSIA